MELATILFMLVGLLFVAVSAVAVISAILGTRHITDKNVTFQEKLAIVNSQ